MKKSSPNSMIKAAARGQLLGKYPTVVFAYLMSEFTIYALSYISRNTLDLSRTVSIVIFILLQFILILLSGILLCGQNYLYLNIARNKPFSPQDVWYGLTHLADRILIIELLIAFHIFLRSLPSILLLALWFHTKSIIAGFFAAAFLGITVVYAVLILLGYSQTLFLILEDPSASLEEVLEAGPLLMHGNVLSYLKLLISFIGLFILSILSFGLGFLWVMPYFHASRTNFYLSLLKKRAQKKQVA